jgi:hypothetical protein
MKSIKLWLMILLLMTAAVLLIGCAPELQEPTPVAEATTIQELKGKDMEDYIGQWVTVEGIFVRDPVPMLVTNLEYVQMNMPIPESEYVLLSGKEAEEIDPKILGGGTLQVTGEVNAIGETDWAPFSVTIGEIKYAVLARPLEPYAPVLQSIEAVWQSRFIPERFAVLFSGGYSSTYNYIRYWNDLKFMYSTLVNTLGFSAENIVVLYADGTAEDNDMPVDFAATQANLETAFDNLRNVGEDIDTIFVFTTNHGGGFEFDNTADPINGGELDADSDEQGDNIEEQVFKMDLNGDGDKRDVVGWDEVLYAWGGDILDDDLGDMLEDLQFNKMIVVMEQCFSGGLIMDMSVGGDQIIISAAGEYEPSWAMTGGSYDEFSYYFTSALNHAYPDGNPVDADYDNDGEVTIVEAFNYAVANDSRNETPQYEDSGEGKPSTGNMPSGKDGILGETIILDP